MASLKWPKNINGSYEFSASKRMTVNGNGDCFEVGVGKPVWLGGLGLKYSCKAPEVERTRSVNFGCARQKTVLRLNSLNKRLLHAFRYSLV